MLDNLARDAERLYEGSDRSPLRAVFEALLFDNGFQAVVFYRLARWFKARGIPFFGPLFCRLGLFFTGAEISAGADIGPGLRISHGVGLVIGGYARIGADAVLLHGVTIGSPSPQRVREMPVIGDRVFVGAGAVLLGAIAVGDDVQVGVNAIVTCDLPSGCRAVAAAALEVRPGPGGPPADSASPPA